MSDKLKILQIVDTDNWCFNSRARCIQQHAPADLAIDIWTYGVEGIDTACFSRYDLVYCLPTNLIGPLRRIFTTAKIDVPLMGSHNSGVGRRELILYETLMAADWTVVNNYSAWAQARSIADEKVFRACNISNGVDLNQFGVDVPIEQRPHRVLWCAAESKVDPNLSEEMQNGKEDVKGYHRILKHLEMGLQNRPATEGWQVDFRVIGLGAELTANQMRQWYNQGSYLVIASTSEGTPNIALEAMACGLCVITTRVGNMPELIENGFNGIFVSERTTRGFWRALQQAREVRAKMGPASRQVLEHHGWDWERRVKYFYPLFRNVIHNYRAQRNGEHYPSVKELKPFTYINTPLAEV